NFPTIAGVFQTTRAGQNDIFIAKISAPTPPPPPPPPGGGGGGNFPADAFEPNETSDAASQLGAISGTRTIANLSISNHPNGLPDYDWYRVAEPTAGNFSATMTNVSGGTLEIHLFTLQGNTLVELSNSQSAVSAAFAAGQAILVEVKGANTSFGVMDQATYSLTLTFA